MFSSQFNSLGKKGKGVLCNVVGRGGPPENCEVSRLRTTLEGSSRCSLPPFSGCNLVFRLQDIELPC